MWLDGGKEDRDDRKSIEHYNPPRLPRSSCFSLTAGNFGHEERLPTIKHTSNANHCRTFSMISFQPHSSSGRTQIYSRKCTHRRPQSELSKKCPQWRDPARRDPAPPAPQSTHAPATTATASTAQARAPAAPCTADSAPESCVADGAAALVVAGVVAGVRVVAGAVDATTGVEELDVVASLDGVTGVDEDEEDEVAKTVTKVVVGSGVVVGAAGAVGLVDVVAGGGGDVVRLIRQDMVSRSERGREGRTCLWW